mmetsp:Transcript_27907/g.67905  ORF Transcript_27907/g.67905 Transcript_27907/m.67905 type:complete len:86 (-) Transcript_27907:135-392(-)
MENVGYELPFYVELWYSNTKFAILLGNDCRKDFFLIVDVFSFFVNLLFSGNPNHFLHTHVKTHVKRHPMQTSSNDRTVTQNFVLF